MMAKTILFVISILLIKFCNAEYDVKTYCQLTQESVKLPSLDSCQDYYTCLRNGMAVKSTCTGNDVFDKDAQTCVPASESNCYFGVSNPCQNKNLEFVYNSGGCNWYNYCLDGQIAGNGTCEIGERFDPNSGTCIYGKCDDSDKTASVYTSMCDIMPDGVYFGDFENCRSWHKCSSMHEEHGLCEDSLVFDASSGYCLPNNGEMCQRTNNLVQSQASGPPQQACTSANQVVGDPNVCSIYYICQLSSQASANTYEWVQLSCKNQYFDVISKQCTGRTLARAFPGCDRCQFVAAHGSSYWANAINPDCQQYLTCSNGKKVGADAHSCEEDYYFDESAQYCIEGEERLEQYEVYNGACQNYECSNDSRECSMVTA